MLRATLANSMMCEHLSFNITQLYISLCYLLSIKFISAISSMCGEKFDLYHDIHMETLLLNTVVL